MAVVLCLNWNKILSPPATPIIRIPAQNSHSCMALTLPAPWLTPEKVWDHQFAKIVKTCLFLITKGTSFCLWATENGKPPFWWYNLGRRDRCKREREERREQRRNVNCNQAAQHVRSWIRSTWCQPGMKAALTIPCWASGSGRHRISEAQARNATHLGAQLRKTNASGHREGISG